MKIPYSFPSHLVHSDERAVQRRQEYDAFILYKTDFGQTVDFLRTETKHKCDARTVPSAHVVGTYLGTVMILRAARRQADRGQQNQQRSQYGRRHYLITCWLFVSRLSCSAGPFDGRVRIIASARLTPHSVGRSRAPGPEQPPRRAKTVESVQCRMPNGITDGRLRLAFG